MAMGSLEWTSDCCACETDQTRVSGHNRDVPNCLADNSELKNSSLPRFRDVSLLELTQRIDRCDSHTSNCVSILGCPC